MYSYSKSSAGRFPQWQSKRIFQRTAKGLCPAERVSEHTHIPRATWYQGICPWFNKRGLSVQPTQIDSGMAARLKMLLDEIFALQ